MNKVTVISDGDGYHLEYIIEMYNSHLNTDSGVKSFSFVRTIDSLKVALKYAYYQKTIVVYTLVNQQHSDFVNAFCNKHKLKCVNLYSDYSRVLSGNFHFTDYQKQLDEEYFTRVECIEFAIDNDDGKNYKKILEADVVILGVSRTGKTPLSMFLALKGLKVVNIPLFTEMIIPEELYKVSKRSIFGLINSVDNISSIRKNRIKSQISEYTSENMIIDELNFAYSLYCKLGCDIINTEDQAVEEIAHYIENIVKEIV